MRLLLLFGLVLVAGCAADTDANQPAPDTEPTVLARPDEASVTARVDEATVRLQSTAGGQLVLDAIDVHGGLARWYSNGPLHVRYRYERIGGGEAIDTRQVIDPWSSRAVHTLAADSSVSFGWDGTNAWVAPDSAALPTNARFWSLTPYYFIGMPFVLADPGVHLEASKPITVEGRVYELVRVTFAPGTGDAPDDYYYLLLDPETRRVGGVRYVVSYPGFFPEGGTTPEKIMLYDGAQTVDGITLQEGFRSFAWTPDGPGEASARGSLTEVRFEPTVPDSMFARPSGASIQEAL